MSEPSMTDRAQNVTPRPGPHQRQRQRQASQGGLSGARASASSPVPALSHGKQTRSMTSQGAGLQQPTPVRKTPGRPLLDPASPFVDKVTAANASSNSSTAMLKTPSKQPDLLQNFSILTPMHFSSSNGMDRDLNNPGFGIGMGSNMGLGLGMGMNDPLSSIVYVEPGVAVATPEHGTTGMVYPGSWMASGGVGMEMHMSGGGMGGAMGGQDPGAYSGYMQGGQGGMGIHDGQMMSHLQGSVGPESRRYPTTLGPGRPPTMEAVSHTPTHGRVASTSISGWDGEGDHGTAVESPTLRWAGSLPGAQQQIRSVSGVPSLTAASRPRATANRGLKRLRQVTHDGTMSMPPPSSHHAASRSVSSVASSMTSSDGGASSTLGHPLTFRPLARMPARTISSTSSASASTASMDYPGSPNIAPTSGYMAPQGNYFEHPMAYHHRRNYSNMSGMTNLTVGTPALDYGMDSPALGYPSAQMLTPVIGQDGNFHYNQAPSHSQQPIYQQLGGLAIQAGPGQPQYLEHIQEETYIAPEPQLEAQYLNQDSTHYQEYSSGSDMEHSMPRLPTHAADIATSQYVQVTQSGSQCVIANTYESGAQPAPAEMGWHPGTQYQQPVTGYSSYSTPDPNVMLAGPSTSGLRHVSTSIIPDVSYGSLAPPVAYPAPRSVSAGYMPMFPSNHLQYPSPYGPTSTNMQHSISFEGASEASYGHRTPGVGSNYGGGVHVQMSEDGTCSPVTEGGDRSAKRNKVKHPTVGKRLRPGPKPKPKTPKKGETITFPSAPDGTLPYDPFIENRASPIVAMQSQEVTVPSSSNQSEFPANPHSAAPPGIAQSSGIAEAASTIPRSYLESCYASYFIRDLENGGAAVKRYRCNIDDCTREFPRKSAIHSHIQTHLEDKPFVCPDSEWQHDLRRHVRIHSGTKPFPCPCGKGFARGDALMRHRQRGICIGSTVPMRQSSKEKDISSGEA